MSWTAFFGAVAGLESIVLVWWSQKIYKIWTRLYLFIVTRWPWGVTEVAQEEVEATQVAPKRSRPLPANNARDACYTLFEALIERLKRKP